MNGNILHGFIDTVAVSMGESATPDIKPAVEEGGIRMASMEDLAAMKARDIYRHGALNRDMVDVYYLLEHMSMADIVSAYEAKHLQGTGNGWPEADWEVSFRTEK